MHEDHDDAGQETSKMEDSLLRAWVAAELIFGATAATGGRVKIVSTA